MICLNYNCTNTLYLDLETEQASHTTGGKLAIFYWWKFSAAIFFSPSSSTKHNRLDYTCRNIQVQYTKNQQIKQIWINIANPNKETNCTWYFWQSFVLSVASFAGESHIKFYLCQQFNQNAKGQRHRIILLSKIHITMLPPGSPTCLSDIPQTKLHPDTKFIEETELELK